MAKLTYKQTMNKYEWAKFLKAIIFPFIALAVSMFSINEFGAYGTRLISPMTALMFSMGTFVSILMPAQRKSTLNGLFIAIICYQAALLMFRFGILYTSGVSTEMLIASFGQTVTLTGGNVVPGYLNTGLNFAAVLTPIGYIGMQAKKIVQFRKNISKTKFFEQTRSIRNNDKKD